MSEFIVTSQDLRRVKRQAKLRSREDKSQSYMQHLDSVSLERHDMNFQALKAKADAQQRHHHTPMSLYLQACQDAYLEL